MPATHGKTHIVYELMLTNASGQELTLMSVAAVAGGQTLLELEDDALGASTRVLGADEPTVTLGVGVTAVVWMDVALAGGADVPTTLEHAIGVALSKPDLPLLPASMTVSAPTTTVSTRKPVELSPPLKGPNWVAGCGCCSMTHHRLAVLPANGQLFLSERFAIDFIELSDDRRAFTGGIGKVESYPGYGAPVTAAGDGTVVAVHDGQPNVPGGVEPLGMPLRERGGNYVVQDLGDGTYAWYAHLMPGSVAPKVGERLVRGASIGRVGNSGHSLFPHLHFEVMDRADPVMAQGLPFVFNKFRVDWRIASDEAMTQLLDTGGPAAAQPDFIPVDAARMLPLNLDVMTY